MKNKKTVFGTVILLFVLIGSCNIQNVFGLEDPDYSVTIVGGHAFKLFWSLNEGVCVKMEYLITGGNADLHLYIRNSTGDVIEDFGTIDDYGIRYFDVPYDDVFEFIFKNNAIFTSRDLELNIDVVNSLTIISPEYGDTFLPGYNYITWTSTGNINYVKIDLYKNRTFLETITSRTSDDGSYAWYIYTDEYTDGSYYQIKISDYYDANTYDYCDYFTIDCEVDKTITIISPKTNDVFDNGNNYIEWSTTGTISNVRIELYYGGSFLEVIDSQEYNDGSYSWYLSSSNIYTLSSNYRIRISDYNDNSIYDFSDYFTIEIEPQPEPDSESKDKIIGIDLIPLIAIISLVTIVPLIIITRRKK